jgi:DNA replication and repair protein RecF
MHLSSIKLTNFKNYEHYQQSLSGQINCFTGRNGVGKTNLLDAVHFMCLLKSHRQVPDRYLVRQGADFFRLEGNFDTDEGNTKVVIKYPIAQRKEIERDGVTVPRLADHVGRFPVVMIAPEDVSLVQEGSEERRRLMDVTLSQISGEYLDNLLIYNALIKQRNALLKDFAEKRRFDPLLLEAIDQQLPAPAIHIATARGTFVEQLRPILADIYQRIAEGREVARIAYDADAATTTDAAQYRSALEAARERDRHMERSTVGPHRDDLTLYLDDRPVKKFASQGQIKSWLLAIRLAQYELLRRQLGQRPLLLLDDIFDKLDPHRVQHLVGVLLERDFGQIFITDTQRDRMEKIVSDFSGDYLMTDID